ncbi:MAG: glycosyltransferase [Phaeodactylibacter sp.]|nr:glycosyltransferase [Phaeodactylibacter sp.]
MHTDQQQAFIVNNSVSSTLTLTKTIPVTTPVKELQHKQQATPPKSTLYLFILVTWVATMLWFQPRLWDLLAMGYSFPAWLTLLAFILFIDFAWLYGIYNISIVLFAWWYKRQDNAAALSTNYPAILEFPPVALLYTTCNDFVEESVQTCVEQDYPNYLVYILDDSSDPAYQARVDAFAAAYQEQVIVVRRPDRVGFKAGNMNYGLSEVANKEKYFAIADADEILPPDFLSKLVPVMEADPTCGFVQANHRANPNAKSKLARALGVGIDIHWKWYQPLRNKYGFVMFLGHGALLRRKCWEEIGGFPHIVSEDLGYAIHIREKGYRGRFIEDVICFEDFPDTVRAFRIRYMKWTRGTCEFLAKKFNWLVRAKQITWAEKLDILFPTLNLPLTLLYFLFMVNANLLLPYFFGIEQPLTLVVGGGEVVLPTYTLAAGFQTIYSWDFYLITLMTFFAPVLCFIVALAAKPLKLFRFLTHSTALYAALSPLSSIGVITYMISGKAIFLVTGDTKQAKASTAAASSGKAVTNWRDQVRQFLHKSHPDHRVVQGFEIATAVIFGIMCLITFQISFLGLCLAFLLLPLMHHAGWQHPLVRFAVYVPFALILLGVGLSFLSMAGMQSVFFGYGFHF